MSNLSPHPAVPSSLSMTSKEIAELTGKQHAHVCRDIRSMLIEVHGSDRLDKIIPEQYRNRHSEYIRENAQKIVSALFGDDPGRDHEDSRGFSWSRDARGYVAFYRLDKDHTLTLLTGYDTKSRFKVMQRWQELESLVDQPSLNPANLSRLQLIELALQAEQERLAIEQKAIALEHRVETLEPKAEALDRISGSEGSLNITEAAKALGVKPKALFGKLQANRWIYKRQGGRNWLGYQDKCQQGLVEHKVSTVTMPDGTEKISEQVRVTPKGITRLSALLNGGAS